MPALGTGLLLLHFHRQTVPFPSSLHRLLLFTSPQPRYIVPQLTLSQALFALNSSSDSAPPDPSVARTLVHELRLPIQLHPNTGHPRSVPLRLSTTTLQLSADGSFEAIAIHGASRKALRLGSHLANVALPAYVIISGAGA